MAISLNPIFPVIAAQGVPTEAVLRPGSVIDAQVLKLLGDNAVRIAIASLAIEVMSEIPLQVGQSLRLAVSQTADGIRLAVVGQQPSATTSAPPGDRVTLGTDAAAVSKAAPVVPTPQAGGLSALEALAVSAAAQSAAIKQAGLSQLYANLEAAVRSGNLPPPLQQAALQLLGRRPALDAALSGDDIQAGFKTSGLFLEQSLASGAATPGAGGAIPDLKAALLVFRQMLSLQPDEAPMADGAPSRPATTPPAGAAAAVAASGRIASPSLTPDLDVQEILLPQARLPVAEDVVRAGGRFTATPGAPLDAVAAKLALNLLQEAATLPGGASPAGMADAADDAAVARTNLPPPPLRGALPAAQAVAVTSLAAGASAAEVVHRLRDDTDAALARQTLLQVASLPERADAAATLRSDPAAARWHFEIPFATPAGTAVAQFEIARDGGGNQGEAEAARRVWRARFSLDVEPAGPVHALVSLSGETTSVRMWAERPATAGRLRAGAAQLSQALSLAELKPGEIVIRDGAPPQPAVAAAGHFLDRAM